MWHPSPRSRIKVAAVAVAVVFTACTGGGEGPGVALETLEADIVFGVEDPAAKESPVPVGNPGGPEGLTGFSTEFEPSQDFDDFEFRSTKFTGPGLRSAPACPPAAVNEFAEREAPLEAEGKPKEGVYRWKEGGQAEFTAIPGQKFPISGFHDRIIRNFQELTPSPRNRGEEFSYEVVEPEGDDGGFVVSTILVKTDAESAEANLNFTPIRRSTGDPERGVSLQKLERFDKAGNAVSTFEPATGLLLFPLQVRQGESWESTAVDPKTGQSITYRAQSKDRVEVDVCGEVISGWLVEGTRAVSGAEPQPYNIVVAPQYGAMIVKEQYNQRTAEGFFEYEFTLGQLQPDPLPEGAQ